MLLHGRPLLSSGPTVERLPVIKIAGPFRSNEVRGASPFGIATLTSPRSGGGIVRPMPVSLLAQCVVPSSRSIPDRLISRARQMTLGARRSSGLERHKESGTSPRSWRPTGGHAKLSGGASRMEHRRLFSSSARLLDALVGESNRKRRRCRSQRWLSSPITTTNSQSHGAARSPMRRADCMNGGSFFTTTTPVPDVPEGPIAALLLFPWVGDRVQAGVAPPAGRRQAAPWSVVAGRESFRS
jgi:hypothetical protein